LPGGLRLKPSWGIREYQLHQEPASLNEEEWELFKRLEGLGYCVEHGYHEPPARDRELAERLREYGYAHRYSEDSSWYLTDEGWDVLFNAPDWCYRSIRFRWVEFLYRWVPEGQSPPGWVRWEEVYDDEGFPIGQERKVYVY
jgi:hypothetical protein